MVSPSRLTILLLALTGQGAAAAAEPATEQDLAYKFGRCLVQQDRQAAIDVLNQLPLVDGKVSLSEVDLGYGAACLGAGLAEVSPIAIRGGIAQELFLRDFQEFGLEPKRKGEFARIALPISDESDTGDAKTRALYKLGDCVVRNRTDATERLLKAPVGSKTERQVIDGLGPIMAACHGSRGQARVSRADLRSVLAQAAYSASVRYWSGGLQAVPR
jgi:hypothetical protein